MVVLVKEYLPGAKAVACNELQVGTTSCPALPCPALPCPAAQLAACWLQWSIIPRGIPLFGAPAVHVPAQLPVHSALDSLSRLLYCLLYCLPYCLLYFLQVLTHLGGMPDTTMKWQTAAASLGPYPPIVRLLGYFTAGQTAQAQSMLQARSVLVLVRSSCVLP